MRSSGVVAAVVLAGLGVAPAVAQEPPPPLQVPADVGKVLDLLGLPGVEEQLPIELQTVGALIDAQRIRVPVVEKREGEASADFSPVPELIQLFESRRTFTQTDWGQAHWTALGALGVEAYGYSLDEDGEVTYTGVLGSANETVSVVNAVTCPPAARAPYLDDGAALCILLLESDDMYQYSDTDDSAFGALGTIRLALASSGSYFDHRFGILYTSAAREADCATAGASVLKHGYLPYPGSWMEGIGLLYPLQQFAGDYGYYCPGYPPYP